MKPVLLVLCILGSGILLAEREGLDCIALRAAKAAACPKGSGALVGCRRRPIPSPAECLLRAAAWEACAAARIAYQACFSPTHPDYAGHMEQIAQAQSAAATCLACGARAADEIARVGRPLQQSRVWRYLGSALNIIGSTYSSLLECRNTMENGDRVASCMAGILEKLDTLNSLKDRVRSCQRTPDPRTVEEFEERFQLFESQLSESLRLAPSGGLHHLVWVGNHALTSCWNFLSFGLAGQQSAADQLATELLEGCRRVNLVLDEYIDFLRGHLRTCSQDSLTCCVCQVQCWTSRDHSRPGQAMFRTDLETVVGPMVLDRDFCVNGAQIFDATPPLTSREICSFNRQCREWGDCTHPAGSSGCRAYYDPRVVSGELWHGASCPPTPRNSSEISQSREQE